MLLPSAELIQQKELEKMKLEEEVAGLKRCGLCGYFSVCLYVDVSGYIDVWMSLGT